MEKLLVNDVDIHYEADIVWIHDDSDHHDKLVHHNLDYTVDCFGTGLATVVAEVEHIVALIGLEIDVVAWDCMVVHVFVQSAVDIVAMPLVLLVDELVEVALSPMVVEIEMAVNCKWCFVCSALHLKT